ncbi:MAG: hypothetical protein AAF623_03025, partial [Planctomycetota bacterium]
TFIIIYPKKQKCFLIYLKNKYKIFVFEELLLNKRLESEKIGLGDQVESLCNSVIHAAESYHELQSSSQNRLPR